MANNKVTKTIDIKMETTDAKGKVKFLTTAIVKLNDEVKKTNKAAEQLAKNLANATKDFKNELKGLEEYRKGIFDKIAHPLKSTGKSVNKAFDKHIENLSKEYEENLPELLKLESKKRLSKSDKVRKEELEKEQADIKKRIKTSAVLQGTLNTVAQAAKALSKPLKQLTTDVLNTARSMLLLQSGVATYSSSSVIANTAARETKLRFGMTSAQAYGFTTAREMLNIKSNEDLYYMNAQQREKLLAYMDRYSKWYTKMEQSGALENIQNMQLDMQEFKMQVAQDLLQWVADNKDKIIPVLKFALDVLKVIATAILNILNFFTGNKYKSTALSSDAYNSGATYNTSRNNNITITANVTNNGDAGNIQQQQDNMWSNIAKQIVTATK